MNRFIKIDYQDHFSSICNSEQEVIESCGYDPDEITFEEFLIAHQGTYEIIRVQGELEWLND